MSKEKEEVSTELANISNKELIKNENTEILNQVSKLKDSEQLKDMTLLFNQNIAKQDMLRASKLSDLLDRAVDIASDNIESWAEDGQTFSTVVKTLQNSMSQSLDNINKVPDSPAIQINTTNINVASEQQDPIAALSRSSRRRILDAINELLQENKDKDIIDAEIEEVEDNG